MSVKRVPSTISVVSSNNISNSSSKVVVSKLSIINEIKDTHQNLIKELLKIRPDEDLKCFIDSVANFQIDILASNLLNKQPYFNTKTEWGKVTAAFQKVPKNIGIKDAWVEYSRRVSKFILMQSGFVRRSN
ncbi:MAG: hypothetical protein VXX85_02815 [Candidatus Margulisiibacteriota bacterium]|nr:hypothetical protein [Candidatus Margulisiibacteriota bacterium]